MDSRNLPGFDNHYSNATLVENWREDRMCRAHAEESRAGGKIPHFTLSGASPQQEARDVATWRDTVSTNTDAYGHSAEAGAGGEVAGMCRPQERPRELLLGGGSATGDLVRAGEPTSSEWGAFWRGDDGATAATSAGATAALAATGAAPDDDDEARTALLSQTAAARQQANVRNLYESNHQQGRRGQGPLAFTGSGSPALYKTLEDTTGHVRGVDAQTNRPGEMEPDEVVADRFATTKTSADGPVAHFYFQRKLPPPTQ